MFVAQTCAGQNLGRGVDFVTFLDYLAAARQPVEFVLLFCVTTDERKPPQPGCQGRAVRILAVNDLAEVRTLLADYRGYFQNAALETVYARRNDLAEMLAGMGLSRICSPGRMATPTMMWHHDGLPCLEVLTRYCDLETG